MAITQSEVSALASGLTGDINEVIENVNTQWGKIIEWFNSNWCSNKAEECVADNKNAIIECWKKYQEVWNSQNNAIRTVIDNENMEEGESSFWPGITCPNLNLSDAIAKTLPNGGVGKRSGADITELNDKVEALRKYIEDNTAQIKATVAEHAAAFDDVVAAALASSVSTSGSNIGEIFTTLVQSAKERFNNEQEARVKMENVNKDNMDIHN